MNKTNMKVEEQWNFRQIEKKENDAAIKKSKSGNKDDKNLNKIEKAIIRRKAKTEESKQKVWMERWMKEKGGKNKESTEKIEDNR